MKLNNRERFGKYNDYIDVTEALNFQLNIIEALVSGSVSNSAQNKKILLDMLFFFKFILLLLTVLFGVCVVLIVSKIYL